MNKQGILAYSFDFWRILWLEGEQFTTKNKKLDTNYGERIL
jgi:hypothetical protein